MLADVRTTFCGNTIHSAFLCMRTWKVKAAKFTAAAPKLTANCYNSSHTLSILSFGNCAVYFAISIITQMATYYQYQHFCSVLRLQHRAGKSAYDFNKLRRRKRRTHQRNFEIRIRNSGCIWSDLDCLRIVRMPIATSMKNVENPVTLMVFNFVINRTGFSK